MSNYQSQQHHSQRRRNQPPAFRNQRYDHNMNRQQNQQHPNQNQHQNQRQHQNTSNIRPPNRNSPPAPQAATASAAASHSPPIQSSSTHSTQSSHPSSNVEKHQAPKRPAAPQQDIRNIPASKHRESNTCYQCGETGHFARECPINQDKQCFNCQEMGHYSRDCPSKGTQEREQRDVNPNVTCYGCGEMGHYSYDCPLKSRGGYRNRDYNNNNNRDYNNNNRDYNNNNNRGNRDYNRGINRDYNRGTKAVYNPVNNNNNNNANNKDITEIFKRSSYDVDISTNDIVWYSGELAIVKHLHKSSDGGRCSALTIRKLGESQHYEHTIDIGDISLRAPSTITVHKTLKALWNEVQEQRLSELFDGSIVKISGKGFGTIVCKKLHSSLYVIRMRSGEEIEMNKNEITRVNEWQMKCDEIHHPYEPRNDNEMDVYDFLEEVADKYMWRFMDEGINSLKYLLTLNIDDLKDIGMALGHRRYFARKIRHFDKDKWSVEKEQKQEERLEKKRVEAQVEKAQMKLLKLKKKEKKVINVILEEDEAVDNNNNDEDNNANNNNNKGLLAPETPQSVSSADVETGYEDDEEDNDTAFDREEEKVENQLQEEDKIMYLTYCDPSNEEMVFCACLVGFALKQVVNTQNERVLLLPKESAFDAKCELLETYCVFKSLFDDIRAVEINVSDGNDIKTAMKINAFEYCGYAKVVWLDPFSMIADENLEKYVKEIGGNNKETQIYSAISSSSKPQTDIMIIANNASNQVFERLKSAKESTFDVILSEMKEWKEINVESNTKDEFWCVLDDDNDDSFVVAQIENEWKKQDSNAPTGLWKDLASKLITQHAAVASIVNPQILNKFKKDEDEPNTKNIQIPKDVVVEID